MTVRSREDWSHLHPPPSWSQEAEEEGCAFPGLEDLTFLCPSHIAITVTLASHINGCSATFTLNSSHLEMTVVNRPFVE